MYAGEILSQISVFKTLKVKVLVKKYIIKNSTKFLISLNKEKSLFV